MRIVKPRFSLIRCGVAYTFSIMRLQTIVESNQQYVAIPTLDDTTSPLIN